MKKLLLSLCVCLCVSTAMAEMPINIGIRGGYSTSKMKLKDLKNARLKSGTGYMVGAFMRLNFGRLYLEPALNYSHKKSEVEGARTEAGPDRPKYDLKMNTFDIPLMFGIQVLDLSILKIRAFLGPQISIGKLKNVEKLGLEDIDKTNWRGKVGVGVDIWKITFDIDYEQSFKELSHELKSPRSFNITLGLKII